MSLRAAVYEIQLAHLIVHIQYTKQTKTQIKIPSISLFFKSHLADLSRATINILYGAILFQLHIFNNTFPFHLK